MAQRYFSSTATAMSLAGSINSLVTSISVNTVAGLPVQYPFTLVIDPGQIGEEIVTVTAGAGTTLTVVRGEDGTTAGAHSLGATVRHMMTARDLRETQQHMEASTAVHGLGLGVPVVGTSTTQVLTNKTMSGLSNTFSDIPQSAVPGLVGSLSDLEDDLDAVAGDLTTHTAATAAHGATGAVVGTTNTQTLTNKTIVAPVMVTPPQNVLNPAGTVIMWAGGGVMPDGYLLCDGSAVNRTTYASLFAVIGVTYGVGNGSTTFNLPNLSGRVAVGFDNSQTEFNAMGKSGGAKTHALTANENGTHTHVQNAHTHNRGTIYSGGTPANPGVYLSSTGGTTFSTNGVATAFTADGSSAATENYLATTATNQNSGLGTPHNNLQPYTTLRYIIKH